MATILLLASGFSVWSLQWVSSTYQPRVGRSFTHLVFATLLVCIKKPHRVTDLHLPELCNFDAQLKTETRSWHSSRAVSPSTSNAQLYVYYKQRSSQIKFCCYAQSTTKNRMENAMNYFLWENKIDISYSWVRGLCYQKIANTLQGHLGIQWFQ